MDEFASVLNGRLIEVHKGVYEIIKYNQLYTGGIVEVKGQLDILETGGGVNYI